MMEQEKQNKYAAKLLEKELRVLNRKKQLESDQHLRKARNDMQIQYAARKEEVLKRIHLMRKQNKSIEDIYKLTSDIILEEEAE